ncbi:MAG: type IV pili methyl-accepting chemotaxis transducer N-terminal domain-containing protein [Pikeienuella sp.]
MRRAVVAIFGLCALGAALARGADKASPPAPGAETVAQSAAALEIRNAVRLGALGERIAMAACFASVGLEADRHTQIMFEALTEFELGIAALAPEVATGELTAAVEGFVAEVAAVRAEGLVTTDQLDRLVERAQPLGNALDSAARAVERRLAGRSLPLDRAIALSFAEREAMLAQRLAKSLCLLAAGVQADAARATLAADLALFEAALDALETGAPDVGILPAAVADAEADLAVVRALWEALSPYYSEIAAGAAPTFLEVASIAAENDRLLAALARASEALATP